MLMIGLGEAGKNIVKLFKTHTKNYKVIVIDEDDGIQKQNTVEEYDAHPFKFKQKDLKSYTEAFLFLSGSGKIAGASLRVLEALKGLKTTVVYIVPDLEFSSLKEQKRHRVHFGVLQENARSGAINEIVILDNKLLLEIAGAGSALKYYEKINYFIYSTIQNLMYCRHVPPDFGKLHEKKDISRISTIGVGNLDQEEKLLFSLDNITETCYNINIEEEDLNNDESIIPKCQKIVRKNKERNRDTSYAIWKSDVDNHFYSFHYTHFIQE